MMEFIAQISPGVAAMANVHPLVVHFPIAWLTAFLALGADLGGYWYINMAWRPRSWTDQCTIMMVAQDSMGRRTRATAVLRGQRDGLNSRC